MNNKWKGSRVRNRAQALLAVRRGCHPSVTLAPRNVTSQRSVRVVGLGVHLYILKVVSITGEGAAAHMSIEASGAHLPAQSPEPVGLNFHIPVARGDESSPVSQALVQIPRKVVLI